MNYKERLNKLYKQGRFTEMAIVNKVKEKRTPEQRIEETVALFKKIISQTKQLDKTRTKWFDMKVPTIQTSEFSKSWATVSYGGIFKFIPKSGNDISFGYYEMEKNLQEQWDKFKREAQKIVKLQLIKKPKYENDISYDGTFGTHFFVIGKAILSQIVAYMHDKNNNRKIKLGTYSHRYDAESEAGGMYGFSQETNYQTKERKIYYWGKNTNKQITYKTFKVDTEDEKRAFHKYFDNIEVVIEEVKK